MNKYTGVVAISLFSGCGGLDVGSVNAGVPVISAIDNDSDCINTLMCNEIFSETHIINKDIAMFKSSEFKKILKNSDYEKFIVIGGPPCQPFSKAGYWVGNKNRRVAKDPRSNLIHEYLRVLADLKPNGFIFENVESLLHPTNKPIIDGFITVVKKLGYEYRLLRVDARDYGVPQRRRRIFVVGSRYSFLTDVPKRTHAPAEMCNGNGLQPHVAVGPCIKEFNKKKYFESVEVTERGTYGECLKEVPPGKNYKVLTAWANHPNPRFVADKRFWSFLLKLSPKESSWTITANPGPWTGPFHWESRRLRVPEIAAIQAFPKGYKFTGTRRSIQRQVGNAVPPLLAQKLISFLCNNLTS